MVIEYAYDDHTGTAAPLHAPVTIGVNSTLHHPNYDANGNQTHGWDFSNPNVPVVRNITFNTENMATEVNRSNSRTSFLYDGNGQRAAKTQGGSSTFYIDEAFEVQNGALVRYIFVGKLRIAKRENNVPTYFHKDHLGSSSVLTNAQGMETSGSDYLPFGLNRGTARITQTGYQFTDQELDAETGLYNYDARLHGPIVGQFRPSEENKSTHWRHFYVNFKKKSKRFLQP